MGRIDHIRHIPAQDSDLDREKRELFAVAAQELLKSLQSDELPRFENEDVFAEAKLRERWRAANKVYEDAFREVEFPDQKRFVRGPGLEAELSKAQKDHAERIEMLWRELAAVFMAGDRMGFPNIGEPQMSGATAKRLVNLLVKLREGR